MEHATSPSPSPSQGEGNVKNNFLSVRRSLTALSGGRAAKNYTREKPMNTNLNFAASLGVMAFLGTGLLMAVIAAFLIYSLAVRRFGRARIAALALLIVGGLYLGLILVFAFASSEKVLARGSEKHFCEIDCHLAYSVIDSKQTKTIGKAPNPVTVIGHENSPLHKQTRFQL
jgi:hypothetical protein